MPLPLLPPHPTPAAAIAAAAAIPAALLLPDPSPSLGLRIPDKTRRLRFSCSCSRSIGGPIPTPQRWGTSRSGSGHSARRWSCRAWGPADVLRFRAAYTSCRAMRSRSLLPFPLLGCYGSASEGSQAARISLPSPGPARTRSSRRRRKSDRRRPRQTRRWPAEQAACWRGSARGRGQMTTTGGRDRSAPSVLHGRARQVGTEVTFSQAGQATRKNRPGAEDVATSKPSS